MSDPFSGASSGFIKVDDLLGRTVLFVPKSKEKKASTIQGQEGKMVDVVMADLIVCDGELTEQIDKIPFISRDFMIWGQVLVGQVRGKIGRKNADGTPAMVAGLMTERPTPKYGRNSKAWTLNGEPDAFDVTAARAGAKAYIAEENTVQDDDPFAAV